MREDKCMCVCVYVYVYVCVCVCVCVLAIGGLEEAKVKGQHEASFFPFKSTCYLFLYTLCCLLLVLGLFCIQLSFYYFNKNMLL